VIGEWIYGLTPRDQQQAQCESVSQDTGALTSTLISWGTGFSVPTDRCMLLQSAAMFAQGNGGQLALGVFLIVAPPGVPGTAPPTFTRLCGESPAAARALIAIDRQFNDLLILPGSRILAFGSFDASAVANTLRLWVTGLLIPRGNIGQTSLAPG
jgi:hypothetical protein